MKPKWRLFASLLGASSLVLGVLTAGQGLAAAAPARTDRAHICFGTMKKPGVLAGGTYSRVEIFGVCNLNAGVVRVRHNLVIEPHAALAALWARNRGRKHTHTHLVVDGNVLMKRGASLVLGCDAKILPLWGATGIVRLPSFPCIDDAKGLTKPTLASHSTIKGSLIENHAEGAVLNNDTIGGRVFETGGGGGTSCKATGIFREIPGFPLPAYSGYLDSTIGGNLTVTDLHTCWFGNFRDQVGGSMIIKNLIEGDPDGNELATNVIQHSLICSGNKPGVQFGDSDGRPNKVGRNATGGCGFKILRFNPAKQVGVKGVKPKLQHVSVHLHH
jgi:hypothetical protein